MSCPGVNCQVLQAEIQVLTAEAQVLQAELGVVQTQLSQKLALWLQCCTGSLASGGQAIDPQQPEPQHFKKARDNLSIRIELGGENDPR